MIQFALFLIGLSFIFHGFYKWMRQNVNYFKIRGLSHMDPNFIFGNTWSFFLKKYDAVEFINKVYKTFPTERIFGIFDFAQPLYIVRDPEILKQLFIKDFDHFSDHRSFVDEKTDKLFGTSLFMLKGDKWRDMRATLSPAFTGSKMRQMFELVTECASDLSKYFQEKSAKGEKLNYEMKNIFQRYTNDVIATSAFGIKVDSLKNQNNEFYNAGLGFIKLNSPINVLKIMLYRMVPFIMRTLKIELMDKSMKHFFRSMVLNNIKAREENNIFRPDMINLLMHVRKGEQLVHEEEDDKTVEGFATVEESNIGKMTIKRKWDDDEIISQCFLFFIAGFDTSSTVLTFLSYELAINQDIQETLYKEVVETNKTLNGKLLTYDTLQQMKYMDMVISETLRKWPPAGVVDRFCTKDYNYNDGNKQFSIEKGRTLWIPIVGLHYDPNYFPNPDKFDPERFNEENKDKIISNSYLPFGIGPRNCIGSRFALMEVKAVIFYLIRDFILLPNENTQIPIKLAKSPFGLRAEKGLDLELRPRKN